MDLSVVIPSCSAANVVACVQAVKQHEPKADIIVADDGVKWHQLQDRNGLLCVPCQKPFVYARNCNLAIQYASPDSDIVLLNDDALLRTTGGFTRMQQLAQEQPEYGVLSPVTNVVGNGHQLPHIQRPTVFGNVIRNEPRMLCFVCVFIPRTTLDLVGVLDERYTAYGFEDDDYCLRVTRAGLKLGIYDGCFVDHASLKSSFRSGGSVDITVNQKIYQQKWGVQ